MSDWHEARFGKENRDSLSVQFPLIAAHLPAEGKTPISGDEIGNVFDDLMKVWRKAKRELGSEHEITKLLDDASGPLDSAVDRMYEIQSERERDTDG